MAEAAVPGKGEVTSLSLKPWGLGAWEIDEGKMSFEGQILFD